MFYLASILLRHHTDVVLSDPVTMTLDSDRHRHVTLRVCFLVIAAVVAGFLLGNVPLYSM